MEGAPRYNELEFFHKPTRTLVVTDLCFNMHKPRGWLAPILLRVLGNYDGFAASRLLRFLVKDKTQFEKSLNRLLEWDFDQILMSHGNPIERDGKRQFREAFLTRGWAV